MAIDKTNRQISFYTPAMLPQSFIEKKNPLTRALIRLGEFADSYAYLGKYYIHASTMQQLSITNPVRKTAIKIVSYVLSAFILLAVAVVAKAIYKNWMKKNIQDIQKKLEVKQEIKKKEIELPPAISKENQERLDRLNQSFKEKTLRFKELNKQSEEFRSAYKELTEMAEVVLQLKNRDLIKLTFKDNKLTTRVRGVRKDPKHLGKSPASIKALQSILETINKAFKAGITEIEVNNKLLSLLDLLIQVEKSPSRFVLQKNPVLNENFSKLKDDILTKLSQEITSLMDDLKALPLPLPEKKEMSHIRLTLPLSAEVLEMVLLKKEKEVNDPNEFRKKFPLLNNEALINGLPFFNMTPFSLMEYMNTLMLDPYTPLQIKSNLLDLFELLLKKEYYKNKIESSDFKDLIPPFASAIQQVGCEAILLKMNSDVLELYDRLHPTNLEVEKNALPAPQKDPRLPPQNLPKIEVIRTALVNGDNEEMKKLAITIAQSLPIFFAPFLQEITYEEFLFDPQKSINEFAKASDRVLLPLLDSLKNSLYNKEIDKAEHIVEMKERHKKFISILAMESCQIGDFFTAGILSVHSDNKEIAALFDPTKKFKAYREKEEKYLKNKERAMIPFIGILLTDLNFALEADAVIAKFDRVKYLNNFYRQLQEYQKRARLYEVSKDN